MKEGGGNFAKKSIAIIVLVLVFIAVCWFSQLYSDGGGIDKVREYLGGVGEKQQSAIERLEVIQLGLDQSIATAGNVAREIDRATNTITTVKDRITDSEVRASRSAELIREGQHILGTIRKRGQETD